MIPVITPQKSVHPKKNRKYFCWLIQIEIQRSGENSKKKSTTTFFPLTLNHRNTYQANKFNFKGGAPGCTPLKIDFFGWIKIGMDSIQDQAKT